MLGVLTLKPLVTVTHHEYFHPAFLYESMLDLVLFFLLLYFVKTEKLKNDGYLFFTYLILYSVIRIAVESCRIDSVRYVCGVPVAIIMSVGIIIVSAVLLIKRNYDSK